MKEGEEQDRRSISPTASKVDQRLEDRFVLRRSAVLQWQLAEARRRREGGHLRQRRRRSDLSHDQALTAMARRSTAARHNYTLTFPPDSMPPVNAFWSVTMYDGKTPVADRESDQPLSDQFADAAGHEEECGRLADALHPEQSRRAPTRNPTGCRRRTARSTWSCGSTGRRRKRPRSCRRAKAPGSRRRSWRRTSVHNGRYRRKVTAAAACAPMRAACRRASSRDRPLPSRSRNAR